MKHLRSGHSHEDIDQVFGSVAFFIIVKHGSHLETPDNFVAMIQRYVNSAPRPHEPERVVVRLDGHRPWWLGDCLFRGKDILLLPRKEFLSLAVPATLTGMGGPGAPHQFDVSRREDLGSLAACVSFWGGSRR